MKNEMIALADYIESEARNNLDAHRCNHYRVTESYKDKYSKTMHCVATFRTIDELPKIISHLEENKLDMRGDNAVKAQKKLIKRLKYMHGNQVVESKYNVGLVEFKLADAIDTTSTYSVTCKPEVEACQNLAKKIRKNAGKSFNAKGSVFPATFKPKKVPKQTKFNLNDFVEDTYNALVGMVANNMPVYFFNDNNGASFITKVKPYPHDDRFVVGCVKGNYWTVMHKEYSVSATSEYGTCEEVIAKCKKSYGEMFEKYPARIQNMLSNDYLAEKYTKHEVILAEWCRSHNIEMHKPEVKITQPEPKIVEAAKSAQAKPKAFAKAKTEAKRSRKTNPVVNAALIMRALAALPKNYHA